MNPAKVVVHVNQRDDRDVLLKLAAEGVGQASEAAHIHTLVEVLPLHETGRDVRLIRIADDFDAFGAKTVHQLREIDPGTKRIRDSRSKSCGRPGQLDLIRESACKVLKEVRSTPRVPRTAIFVAVLTTFTTH